MTRTKIDISQLERAQLERLLVHLDSRIDAIIGANNTLRMKLEETGDLSDRCPAILEDWTTFLNRVSEQSSAEVAKLVGGRAGQSVN